MDRGIVLLVTASILVIALAYVVVFSPAGLLKRRELRDAIETQQERNGILAERIESTGERIARLRRSSEETERAARELGYARLGDIVFIVDTPHVIEPPPPVPRRVSTPSLQALLVVLMIAAAVAGIYFVRKAVTAS